MNASKANLINSVTLIIFGLWGYFGSVTPSFTALIPVFAGVILLAMTPGIKKDNAVIGHIAVVLTFIILVALVKPLTAGLDRADNAAAIRVIIMMLTSALAMAYFVKSFIDARKKKSESN